VLQNIQATFLLSGWTKGGEAAQHVVRVVDAQALEAAKAQLEVITALHVYSVQPALAKDSSDLYNADYAQTEALFRKLLASSEAGADDNPLAANLLSAVQCAAARRDPNLAAQRPKPAPKPAAAAAEPAAAKPLPAATSPAAKPKGKSSMEKMWAKASPPKSKPAPSKVAAAKAASAAPKKAAPQKAAPEPDPEFAMDIDSDSSSSDDSSSSEEEEEEEEQPAVMARPAGKGRAKQTIDDSVSDEDFKEPPAKQAKQTKAAAKKPSAAAKPKHPAAKKPSAAAKRKQPAGGEQEGPSVDARARPKSRSKAAPKAKAKMMKTYFNDAGEEVTGELQVGGWRAHAASVMHAMSWPEHQNLPMCTADAEMVEVSDDEAGAPEAQPAPAVAHEPAAPEAPEAPAAPAAPVQQTPVSVCGKR